MYFLKRSLAYVGLFRRSREACYLCPSQSRSNASPSPPSSNATAYLKGFSFFHRSNARTLFSTFLHGNSGVGKGMESLVKRKYRVLFFYLNVKHFILGIPIRSTLLRRMLFIPL